MSKKILLIIASIILVAGIIILCVVLFGKKCDHEDKNFDLECDLCGEKIDPEDNNNPNDSFNDNNDDDDQNNQEGNNSDDSVGNNSSGDDKQYIINSIKNNGVDMANYKIAVERNDLDAIRCAEKLKVTLESCSGYELDIVDLAEYDSECIVIKQVDWKTGLGGDKGFRVFSNGDNVYIYSAYPNKFISAFDSLIEKIKNTDGEINFSTKGNYFDFLTNTICYNEFESIVGDGKTNDFDAIKALHDFANANGQKVMAESGKSYYMKRTENEYISIQTDTDFGNAKFIIENTAEGYGYFDKASSVFVVEDSNNLFQSVALGEDTAINSSISKLEIEKNHNSLVILANNKEKIYTKLNSNDIGYNQQEVLIIDRDGYVSDTTDIYQNFSKLTSCSTLNIDIAPITVKGGTFEILTGENFYLSIFLINRPNVSFENVEKKTNSTDAGFAMITLEKTYNIRLSGCKFQSEDQYLNKNFTDVRINNSVKVVFENCVFSLANAIFSRNLEVNNSKIAGLDTCIALFDLSIKNSEVGKLDLVGGGDFLMENSNVFADCLLSLNEDYGSSWNGSVTVRNSEIYQPNPQNSITLIKGNWHKWNFGTTYMPKHILIDNLTVSSECENMYILEFFSVLSDSLSYDNNILKLTEDVIVQNSLLTNLEISENTYLKNQINFTK